jgi:vitamin B12 transporter
MLTFEDKVEMYFPIVFSRRIHPVSKDGFLSFVKKWWQASFTLACLMALFIPPALLWGSPQISPSPDDSIHYYLPEVHVVGERWRSPEDSISGSLVVASTADRSGRLDALLRDLQGVTVSTYGGAGSPSTISLRGSSPDQVLFLLDGVPLNTAQGGGIDLSLWPSQWIDRAEIFLSGGAITLGSRALGGAVNLIPKPPLPGTTVGLHTGSGETHGMDFSLDYGDTSSPLNLGLTGSISQGTGEFWYIDESRDSIALRRNTDHNNRALAARASLRCGPTVTTIDMGAIRSDRGAPGPTEFPTPDARLEDATGYLHVMARHPLPGSARGRTIAYLHTTSRHYYNPHPILYADDSHDNDALGFQQQVFLPWRSHHSTLLGLHLRKDCLHSTTDGDHERDNASLFIQDRLAYALGGTTLEMTPGLRAEWTQGLPTQLCPGIGLTLSPPGGRWLIRILGERTYRPPTFDDLFWPASAMAVGNPHLKPEVGTNLESGIVLYPNQTCRLGFQVYHREVRNLIQWTPGAGGTWRPHNLGRARMEGIETTASVTVPTPIRNLVLEGSTNYSLLIARDLTYTENKEFQLVRRPRHRANGSFIARIGTRIEAGLNIRYTGCRYTTPTNTKCLPSYLVTDIHAAFRPMAPITLAAEVSNITDQQYVDVRDFPIPGRTWQGSLIISL